ncbi:MAG: GcrA cell cycle regulator [Brevundimonas sp.]|nr:MAG: GcrA cell cycle regulator [Brevundimonas sp.]
MTASAWTPDRVARLKALWGEGRSATEIARALGHGISRSAVLGKVYRLGLSAGRPRRFAPATPRQPPARGRRAGPRVKAADAPPVTPAAPVRRRDERAWDLPSGGLDLLALRRGQCRWPHGDPETGLSFCGRPVARGAFCGGHAEVAYRAPPGGAEGLAALAGLA